MPGRPMSSKTTCGRKTSAASTAARPSYVTLTSWPSSLSNTTILFATINETMAREYWQGEDTVGKRFKRGASNPALAEGPWITIVGIVGDVRQIGVDQPVKEEMYFPHRQINLQSLAPRELVLRASVDPLSLVA